MAGSPADRPARAERGSAQHVPGAHGLEIVVGAGRPISVTEILTIET